MLNIPLCQSVNNSGWVEVAANLSITLYISDFCRRHTVHVFYVTTVQLAGGQGDFTPQAKSLIKLGPQIQNVFKRVFGLT